MTYAGIGSRKTPREILKTMVSLGVLFAKKGFILRSGGASGADSAFEEGCDKVFGKKEIYLPWKGFNGNTSDLYEISEEAFLIAEKFHPAWNRCSNSAKKLLARNTYQILGYDLNSPANFIVCYSEGSGGTEQALRVARAYQIPVFNLFHENWKEELCNFFKQSQLLKENFLWNGKQK